MIFDDDISHKLVSFSETTQPLGNKTDAVYRRLTYSGSNGATFQVFIEENEQTVSREGTVTIAGEGLSADLPITQNAKPYTIFASPSNIIFHTAGSNTITLDANVSWLTTINYNGTITVSLNPTSGPGNVDEQIVQVTCSGPAGQSSSAEVVFYNTTYGLSSSVWIIWQPY